MTALPRSCSRRGATLVEVLVALGIGALILGVIFLAYHTLSQNASRQLGRINTSDDAHYTIDELRGDLLQLFATDAESGCEIELENSATDLIRLAFCRWENSTGKEPLMTNRLTRVTFQRDSGKDSPRWVRIHQALTGPDAERPPATNRLEGAWPRLMVHLHDGDSWKTNWTGATDARPRAARILLLDEQMKPAHETMVIIPSGLSVTSTILRTGTTSSSR